MKKISKEKIKESSKELLKEIPEEKTLLKLREKLIAFSEDSKGNLKFNKQISIFNISNYFLNNYNLFTFSDSNEIFIYSNGIYEENEKFISGFSNKILNLHSSTHAINEIINFIKRASYEKREKLIEPENKICLENGILNLKTLELENFSPDLVFFNKIPVKFDKNADCPSINKFLDEIVEEDDKKVLIEFTGFCLLKNYSIQKSFMLVGGGANGKSLFLRLLKRFLGKKNVCSIPLQRLENNRFSLSSLFGKLANIFADLPSKALEGTSIFKMLTGEDLIPAEKKFKDEFFFENYAKMIFSANQIPKSPENTDAFFRRWIIVNFPNQFLGKNADKSLIKNLTTPQELSGLLNLAIEGLKNILSQGDFSCEENIKKTRETYIRLSDSIGSFIMDKILISPEDFIEKKKLYTRYCDYCRKNKMPVEAENYFHKELQAKIRIEDYRPSLDNKRVQCWRGIKLNDFNPKFERREEGQESIS